MPGPTDTPGESLYLLSAWHCTQEETRVGGRGQSAASCWLICYPPCFHFSSLPTSLFPLLSPTQKNAHVRHGLKAHGMTRCLTLCVFLPPGRQTKTRCFWRGWPSPRSILPVPRRWSNWVSMTQRTKVRNRWVCSSLGSPLFVACWFPARKLSFFSPCWVIQIEKWSEASFSFVRVSNVGNLVPDSDSTLKSCEKSAAGSYVAHINSFGQRAGCVL